ncbi:uncharacterized protein BP01DRAFT_357287 [Aspergillus saccharolyticus JOP 1030-1]|uniref:Vacuolar ATPase assembly protein VMA22 n=1 Tax=Aspergillus saccharolyticus JOP 1030-1 TaxID=1450539 RepID=A0A318ZE84_9EURO|nr:hypothetical protein BP01DRAFT_357287 [Aspergillus saccharolyticus JOP 1030-1]PYH44937.1 hypothetical protein BP01DRAFT_357287 [Aspergillus saccharolyticus JOP 1030-1]
MAQIPTPPASRHGSPSPEHNPKKSEIEQQTIRLQTLDELLERYLHLLDEHQKLQADLGSRLSSGFISLAQANFTSSPGRRYGADYYDERMKATRRVRLSDTAFDSPSEGKTTDQEEVSSVENNFSDSRFQHTFAIDSVTVHQPEEESQTDDQSESSSTDDAAKAGDEETEKFEEYSDQTADSMTASDSETFQAEARPNTKSTKAKPRFRSSDPINWYGILVPLSLRSAQKTFTEAVEGQVVKLANVVGEMRTVEKQIKQVRSAIGQEQVHRA